MGTPAAVCSQARTPALYQPRRPRETPLYKLVAAHFDEFERVYPERYQADFGFWRPVIRESVDEFLKCGDLHHGFARVRCEKCGHDFLVAFSCKKRCVCPSCHQKRVLVFAERLAAEICSPVPHRQFVFTIPKRFRLYFRYDRSLLGKLCLAAWCTVREVYRAVLDDEDALPGMVGSIQTFGELIHWHPHIHALVTDGAFRPDGMFLPLPRLATEPFLKLWEHKVYRLLLDKGRITEEVVRQMQSWRHSGFSVHREVFLPAGDRQGIENLAQYIARCPFSQARMLKVGTGGNVVYKAEHAAVRAFPHWKVAATLPGIPRNFEVFKPLDFLAQVTQHIPDRSQHLVRYYGWYSNRSRGKRMAAEKARSVPEAPHPEKTVDESREEEYRKAARRRWAALIKKVYEVDPLVCPKCGGKMEIIAFITEAAAIRKILTHLGEYRPADRAPPVSIQPTPPASAPAWLDENDYLPAEEYT